MCHAKGLYHSRSFQFNVLSAEMLEQSDTFTEEYGHQVNMYFVERSSFDALLSGIRAHHPDIFVTGGRLRLSTAVLGKIEP